jgi:hypothetical protein
MLYCDARNVRCSDDHLTIFVHRMEHLSTDMSWAKSLTIVFKCPITLPKFKEWLANQEFPMLEELTVKGETSANILSVRSMFAVFPQLIKVKTFNIFGVRNADLAQVCKAENVDATRRPRSNYHRSLHSIFCN